MVAHVVDDPGVTARLGTELLTSRVNANHAVTLITTLAASTKEAVLCEAARSLQVFFLSCMGKNESVQEGNGSDDADGVFQKWLKLRYKGYVKALRALLEKEDTPLAAQKAALDALLELARAGEGHGLNNDLFMEVVQSLVSSSGSGDILAVTIKSYAKYADVRYFLYSNIQKLADRCHAQLPGDIRSATDSEAKTNSQSQFAQRATTLLFGIASELKTLDNETAMEAWAPMQALEAQSGAQKDVSAAPRWTDPKKRKRVAADCWLAVLKLPLPMDVYKKVLVKLRGTIIPLMSSPILLSDFLTDSYNVGGVISVMALDGLFTLIMQHGLEYPDYYNKLYALLEPSIFVAKYRARFFELADLSLRSPHLPAYLAAAFAKRMSRLALSAPPAGCTLIIAFVHNLLRRHPAINVLVHRGAEDREAGGEDPFLTEEKDTAKCNALKSSLWEMETLRHHYCPSVSRFVSSLEKDLTVKQKTAEVSVIDFSGGSYSTLLQEEAGRRLKKVSLAFYPATPDSLFAPQRPGLADSDDQSGEFKGWAFGKHRGDGKNAGDLAYVGEEQDSDDPDDDDDDEEEDDDEEGEEGEEEEGEEEGEEGEEGEEEEGEEGYEEGGEGGEEGEEGEEEDDDDEEGEEGEGEEGEDEEEGEEEEGEGGGEEEGVEYEEEDDDEEGDEGFEEEEEVGEEEEEGDEEGEEDDEDDEDDDEDDEPQPKKSKR